jgi:hypothetical protein
VTKSKFFFEISRLLGIKNVKFLDFKESSFKVLRVLGLTARLQSFHVSCFQEFKV